MKIAVVTNDGTTISAHFGQARYYIVLTVEDGKVVGQEQREKNEYQGAEDTGMQRHTRIVAPITDCNIVLSGGMGAGMYRNLQQAHIRPILTDVEDINEAVTAYIEGRLRNKPELVH